MRRSGVGGDALDRSRNRVVLLESFFSDDFHLSERWLYRVRRRLLREQLCGDGHRMNFAINPLIARGSRLDRGDRRGLRLLQASVSSRRRVWAANWSAIWYMLSAFAVISYTENALYVAFAALGSWLGAFASVTWLHRAQLLTPARHDPP
jgi:hypothetical protein